jgi:hypothetical protein
MEPVLPDAPLEESEFDLDVRLEAVREHSLAEPAMKPSDQCPDDTSDVGTCRGDLHGFRLTRSSTPALTPFHGK